MGLKIIFFILIVQVCVFWCMSQVELQITSCLKSSQLNIVINLTLNHGEVSITYSHYREMISLLLVNPLSPLKNLLHSFGKSKVSMWNKTLRVTWNIEPIQIVQLRLDFVYWLCEIYWDNSCSTGLKKLNMSGFNELLLWENLSLRSFKIYILRMSTINNLLLYSIKLLLPLLTVAVISAWNRLRKNTNNWNVSFGPYVMTGSYHWRLSHDLMLALWIFLLDFTI